MEGFVLQYRKMLSEWCLIKAGWVLVSGYYDFINEEAKIPENALLEEIPPLFQRIANLAPNPIQLRKDYEIFQVYDSLCYFPSSTTSQGQLESISDLFKKYIEESPTLTIKGTLGDFIKKSEGYTSLYPEKVTWDDVAIERVITFMMKCQVFCNDVVQPMNPKIEKHDNAPLLICGSLAEWVNLACGMSETIALHEQYLSYSKKNKEIFKEAIGKINELWRQFPSIRQLWDRGNNEVAILTVGLVPLAIDQLASLFSSKSKYHRCFKCGKYGSESVMTKIKVLSDEDKIRFGFPLNQDIWLHRVDGKKEQKSGYDDCYRNVYEKNTRDKKAIKEGREPGQRGRPPEKA